MMRMVKVEIEDERQEYPYLEANESFFDSRRMLSMLRKVQLEENKKGSYLESSHASSNSWSMQALLSYLRSLILKMRNIDENLRNIVPIEVHVEVPIQSFTAINKPNKDLEWWKHLPQSAPISIPPRKIEPLWVENSGWVKFQHMYR